jgi:hypothetical protein
MDVSSKLGANVTLILDGISRAKARIRQLLRIISTIGMDIGHGLAAQ